MHTAVQPGGVPGRSITASSPSQLKTDASQNASTPTKSKKRERTDSNSESSKRERSLNPEEGDSSSTKIDHAMRSDEAANFEDGGLSNAASVEKLVSVMQQDRNDGVRKPADMASRRTVLAAAIAATENHECLDRFVQLGGVRLLDEWLQEAPKGKCGDGESPKDANKGVEELLLTIMSALEKLPVDLVALRTCQVGKSVNNHRSHKNVEIKEKARKLVDTWKKRVDEEVNSTGDTKTGLNHVNSWSSKSLPLNMCTSDLAGQQAAGVKTSNGPASGASTTKFKASSTNKDEKGNGANQSQNNGHQWSNHVAGALTWKDEVKSSTSPSSASKSNNPPNYRASNLHGKGLSGLNPTATQKESTMGKPLVWSRSGVNEKGADASVPESSPQKLILRLPNPGRSSSVSVNGEAFGPGSQGSSPNLPEQTSASSIVDASDMRHKLQVSGGKYSLPSDVSIEQHQTDGTGNLKDEPSKEDEPLKEDEPEEKQSTEGKNKSEVSRTSDSPDKGNTMAIVPISAVSRISGGERDAGVSGRSVIMSEVGTVDQEIARSAVEPETAEVDARSECKEEARRKDTQDGVDGANCASSSSFTEMSVAGQGGNPDHKNQCEDLRETISSNNADESTAVARPRLEQEGLGESPELRSCTSQALKRSESSAGDFSAALKHGADQSGDAYQSDKRGVTISADVSSTQGPKIAPFGGRGSYEGLGRRLERYENSWDEKRNSYPFEKGGRSPIQHCKSLAFDCKSSSEGGSRKTGTEQEKVEENKKMDSTSDFVEDDALEVAQQIAKEVEQEMESYCKPPSHLSSVKDGRDTNSVKMHHLSTKEADSSSRQLSDKCSFPIEKQENGDQLLGDGKAINRVSSNADSVAGQSQGVGTEPVLEDKKTCEVESEKVPGSPSKASEGYTHVGSEKANHCQPPTVPSSKTEEPVKQEKSTEGNARPDFDLNEGLAGEEGLKEVCSVLISNPVASIAGPTTPIAVLPTTKGAFIPPESLMKVKAEPGWKGSAATSAFRPAEPRRVHEVQPNVGEGKDPGLAQSGKVVRLPLDIDLNVADEKAFSDAGFDGQGLNSFTSRPVSERQAAVSSSQATGRVAFDLNCADECEDGTGLDVKIGSSGLPRKDTQGNGGIARGVTRDFDLNGPMVDDVAGEEPVVQHLSLRSSENSMGSSVPGFRMGGDLVGVAPWFPSGNSFSAVAIPAFPMARAESTYSVPAQPFLNAGGIHFNVDLYRGGMTLATPAVAYPTNPPVAYPYGGFPFASNYSFNSSASFPAGSASYVDASGSTSYPAVSSQIGGPGVMSRFIRPHLMGITETARADGNNAWVRPSLDLNTGPEASESDVRVDLRPPSGPMNGRGVPLEDHLRGFSQVAPTGKRKEPESGWEAFQAGYKQPTWC